MFSFSIRSSHPKGSESTKSQVAEHPTVEQLTEKLKMVRAQLAELTVHESFTIDDYPIGGRHRGKCKLWVDAKQGHGYRMSRATTDKNGRWCNPKSSVYHDSVIVVVTGPIVERDTAWLEICARGVYLYSASWGETTTLLKAPCDIKPNRLPRNYTMGNERHTIPADASELCDLWDVWQPAVLELMSDFAHRLKQVCST